MSGEDQHWLDKPENVQRMVKATYVLCGLLVLTELLSHVAPIGLHMHPHFEIDKIPGFYALVGFLAFVIIVKMGELLRKLIQSEGGYGDE